MRTRNNIPGRLSTATFGNTRFAKQDPARRRNEDGTVNVPTSFSIMDGFRAWAKTVGMSAEVAERHILTYRGKGVDALYAGLKVVRDAYERKDREYN